MDLLISEGMSGKETIRVLRQRDPDVKCIATSGLHDEAKASVEQHGFSAFIGKPFDLVQIRSIVSSLISEPVGA